MNSRIMMAYRAVRNLYVHELRAAKRCFYRSLVGQLSYESLTSRPHYWWKRLKSISGWKSACPVPPLSDGSRVVLDSEAKAELLNASFAKQCSNPPAQQVPRLPRVVDSGVSFVFEDIMESDVLSALRDLNVWMLAVLDGLSANVLRECSSELAGSLAFVLNLSLAKGVYPVQWKEALVHPVYKNKGNKASPASYRPISLLSIVSKVFGRLVKRQLLSFFLGNHVIPDEQFGFLPGRSTLWHLLQVLEEWQQALDAGGTFHALFIDVAKAFDRVDHGLFLSKLHSVGLSQPALDGVSSYLASRCIRTTVDNRISGVRPISSGVPQGSVLGPLLFLIYFRDIPSAVSSSSAMFADDTLVYTVGCDCHENKPSAERACTVALDVSALSQWSKVWNTVFNAAKSNDMLISRQRSSSAVAPFTLDGVDIPRLSVTNQAPWCYTV